MEQLLLLLIFLPLLGAIATALSGRSAKFVALASGLLSLGLTFFMISGFEPNATLQFVTNTPWIEPMGVNFHVAIDGISVITVLLTNLLIPVIILSGYKHEYKNMNAFYALVLFMQTGLLLVFTALDAFLFYIGWEAALIPIYFICAIWGGKDRVKVNMKFFEES